MATLAKSKARRSTDMLRGMISDMNAKAERRDEVLETVRFEALPRLRCISGLLDHVRRDTGMELTGDEAAGLSLLLADIEALLDDAVRKSLAAEDAEKQAAVRAEA